MSEDKNAGGRPLKYQTAEEMQKVIDDYFDYCDNRIKYVFSKVRDEAVEMIAPEPYTIAGLAYHLDMDRRTLLDYSNRDEFLPTIKRAKSRVAMDVERRLMEGAGAGAIFNLKNNFGYTDVSQVDGTQEIRITTRKLKKDAA
jgi:hypothetical protein